MEKTKDTPGTKQRNLHWAIVLSLILLVGLIWIFFDFNSEKNELESLHQDEVENLKQDFREHTLEHYTRNYELLTKTLSWLVRQEMLRENLQPVNDYFNILVKEEEIIEIILADPDGKIMISTNKKNQDKSFADLYKKEYLQTSEAGSYRENGYLFLVSPVFGYENRLATLVLKTGPKYFTSE